MTPEFVITIARQAIEVATLITAVVLLPALAVGLLVSMFQAATQLNEQTLSFIPKLIVTFLTIMIAGPWILQLLIDFTNRMIGDIPFMVN